MSPEPRTFETSIATLIRVRADMVEVRYRPGSLLEPKGIAEVQELRRSIMADTPYGMITLLPENIDFELHSMQVDHMAADRREGLVMATVVVAAANMIEMLVKIYFSYFPQLHRINVTSDEAEARAWLNAQMEEVAKTGS